MLHQYAQARLSNFYVWSDGIDGHGSEPQPRGILPSARVGGSFETLRGEDSPHRSGWGPDRGVEFFYIKQ